MRGYRSASVVVTLIGLLLPNGLLGAAEDSWRQPAANRNQFPLALLFLYLEPERASVLADRESSLVVDFDYSNIILSQETGGESVFLDAEYLATTFRFERGLGGGFQLGVSLPFYVMYGGFLDGFISGLHNALDLPNAMRERFPEDQFEYRYTANGEPLLERLESGASIGDLSARVKKAWIVGSANELALRAAVKLPTGNLEDFSGSGASDVAVGVAASRVGDRFGAYLNLNVHFLGEPDRLRTQDYFSWMGALDVRLKPSLAMIVQYEQLQPFLENELPALGKSARQLVLGLRWRRSDRFQFEWRLTEDLSTASPDFTFGFRLALHWKDG